MYSVGYLTIRSQIFWDAYFVLNIYWLFGCITKMGFFSVDIGHYLDQKCLGCCMCSCLELKGKETFLRNSLKDILHFSKDKSKVEVCKYFTALFDTDSGYIYIYIYSKTRMTLPNTKPHVKFAVLTAATLKIICIVGRNAVYPDCYSLDSTASRLIRPLNQNSWF
jgi:hypothetical protein